jgi:two-component system sensor histidine kinase ChvG
LRQTGDIQTPLRGLPERKDEIGQLSQALSDMTAELQRRIQATAKFAADVSHEIKNPLTSLRSAVETVARIDNPEQQRKLMDVILTDVNRLDRLITDISQASRVDAELTGQTPEPEDITALLESWAEVSRARFGQQRLSYQPYKKPLMVRMYNTRIIQILDNLLANAMTFHSGDAPILLSVKRIRGQVQISLADKGPGLPPGKEERIFDRFYTERPSSEGFGKHSGLGLSIARQIAIAHGGQLKGASDKSGGAVFTLTLPLAN